MKFSNLGSSFYFSFLHLFHYLEVRKLSQTDNITHYAYKNHFAQNLGDRDKIMLVENKSCKHPLIRETHHTDAMNGLVQILPIMNLSDCAQVSVTERKNLNTKMRHKSVKFWGFLGGSVVKNPPASAGDKGSVPGPGSSHTPQSN